MSRTQSQSKTVPRRSQTSLWLGLPTKPRRTTAGLTGAGSGDPRTTTVLAPRGFTLIEMLVAVALVLIMMAMFAEIFQIAGGSIAKTRGLAENDQRSRTLQTIIKADLDKRSFRWVYPFAAGESFAAPESNIGDRKGYFYISENNPYNSLDDVLQFTMMSTITSRNKDESLYYGQALNLTSGSSTTYQNQPDYDDLQLGNNTADSTVAEVVYFVRNGSLYRRQLLVREAESGSNPEPDDAPTNNNPSRPVFDPTDPLGSPAYRYLPGSSTFWADFDFSAYYNENASNASTGAHFLGTNSLNNNGSNSLGAIAGPFRRFGHYHRGVGVTGGHAGRPKEFIADTSGAEFIGRFTLQECSDPDFQYPQSKTSGNRIPTDPTSPLTLDTNDKSINGPDDFGQGPRRGEDLLLSNVHAFDVLVWDENYGDFVNIGDPKLPSTSDYTMTKRRNIGYGPRLPATVSAPTVVNAVFDTWHPFIELDGTSPPFDHPPFRPITYRPDYLTGTEPTPTNNGGQSEWRTSQVYNLGDIVFPIRPVANPAYPYPGPPFYYRCVQRDRAPKNKGKGKGKGTQGNNTSDDTDEPSWPRIAGVVVEDNALSWQAVDNRKPLKAIKLEIRFIDPSTQQLRQLTIVHSLVD